MGDDSRLSSLPPVPHLEVSGAANPTRVEGWLNNTSDGGAEDNCTDAEESNRAIQNLTGTHGKETSGLGRRGWNEKGMEQEEL
jgi:hypothetical protein